MRIRLLNYIITLSIITTIGAHAQVNRAKTKTFLNGLSVEAKIGPNKWMGDLVDNGSFRLSGGGAAEKELNYFVSAELEFTAGRFAGKMGENQSFKTNFVEIFPGIKLYPLDLIMGYYPNRILNPYFGIGGGPIIFKANKEYHDKEAIAKGIAAGRDMSWCEVKIGPKVAFGVSGILGVKYPITHQISAMAELRGVYVGSDELDGHTGWSGKYSMPLDVLNSTRSPENQMTEEEYKKGQWHPSSNDCYYTFTIGVAYKIKQANWRMSSRYNRRVYIENKRTYRRNVQGRRRSR